MKKTFFLGLFATAMVACTEAPNFTITGTVDDATLNGLQVYLYAYGDVDAEPIGSALIKQGAFELHGVQNEAVLAVLTTDKKHLQARSNGYNAPYAPVFVLENATYQTELDKDPTLTGTPENDAYKVFQQKIIELRAKQTIENEEQIEAQVVTVVKSYAKKFPQSMITAKILVDFRHSLDEQSRRAILEKAQGAFDDIAGIEAMKAHHAMLAKVAIGQKYTDFEMMNIAGHKAKLSDYVGSGKVVLIDFWASWCPPCRRDMPHLVALYKKYSDKGFEIVGVSLDSKQDAWEKGVKDLSISWPQLSDLKGWENVGAALYGVNSIPHTVLVTRDGTIAAKNLHGAKLEEKLKELLK